jgi:hypothetical protein
MSVSVTSSPVLVPDDVIVGNAPIAAFHAWLLRDAIARSPDVTLFRDYYNGRQPHSLTDGQLVMLEGLVVANPTSIPSQSEEWAEMSDPENVGAGYLCDNITKIVVDALQSRVLIDGFRVDDAAVQEFLDVLWVTAGVDDLQNEVHRNAFRDADSYIILGYDPTSRRITMDVQQQWAQEADGSAFGAGTHMVYDDMGRPWVAIKEWVEYATPTLVRRRRTLYYGDRIERYYIDYQSGQQNTEDWQPFLLDGDVEWPVLIRAQDGRDVTLPVVHFPNVRGATRYGISELAGDILGKQRLYNDAQHALAAATRMSANQLITATGVTESESAEWKVGPAQVLGSARDTAKIGAIGAADLSPIIDSAKRVLESVSHSSSIPLHHFTGQWPSGEALMRAEIPMVSKARDRQTRMGHAWASLMHKATLISNSFDGTTFDTEKMISVSWHDPALRDDKYIAQTMALKAPFISEEQVLRELGYTEQQIGVIMRERAEKAKRDAEQALALAPPPPPDPDIGTKGVDREPA